MEVEEVPVETNNSVAVPELLSYVNYNQYTCGTKWSSNGETCAVSSETSVNIYSYYQNSLSYRASIKHAECLYDWQMIGADHIVTTGRYQPVHLYKISDNKIDLQSTYKCINHLDELSHAYSVALVKDGSSSYFYLGLKGEIRVFDINRPSDEFDCIKTKVDNGQNGIISCLSLSETSQLFAAGSYDRTVGLYSVQGERLCVLKGQQGGVTQVSFSQDGMKLLTGGRKDNEIICWDLRQPGSVLWTVNRIVSTNQTVAFSQRDNYLGSGGTDGSVRIWDMSGPVQNEARVLEPIMGWSLHTDSVVGISWHPSLDIIATSTGQRHFPDVADEEEDDYEQNMLAIWDFSSLFRSFKSQRI